MVRPLGVAELIPEKLVALIVENSRQLTGAEKCSPRPRRRFPGIRRMYFADPTRRFPYTSVYVSDGGHRFAFSDPEGCITSVVLYSQIISAKEGPSFLRPIFQPCPTRRQVPPFHKAVGTPPRRGDSAQKLAKASPCPLLRPPTAMS